MMRPQQKMSDAAASFLRCSKLAGHPRDAAAWRAMCEYANSALVPPSSGLADLHVILAQAVMGDDAALDVRARQMEDLARERRYPSGSYFPVLSRFTAYERWDFSTAIEVLAPLAGEGERIGGGRAQHDLIEFTLLKAYLEVDRLEEARHLLSARRPGLPAFPLRGLRRCTNLRSSQLHGSVPSCRHRRRKLILRAPNNNRRAGLDHEYHESAAVAGEGGRYVLFVEPDVRSSIAAGWPFADAPTNSSLGHLGDIGTQTPRSVDLVISAPLA
ncbi:MAG: hypothetical protein WA864_31975 [Acetobacteraceae bacterium]|jgi:hypothetical protein